MKNCNCGNHCNCNHNKRIQTMYLGDVAVDSLDSLPDFFLVERDVTDIPSGDIIRTLTRIPAGRLFPNGNYQFATTIAHNNSDLEIPERQVIAGTVKNLGSSYQVQPANVGDTAIFLVTGLLGTDLALIQRSGFVNIPAGHDYIINQQYYLGENGEPVTTESAVKLFIPVSRTQLMVTL